MRIGFDFDGTITKNPFLFKNLIDALSSKFIIYIISGTTEKDRITLLNELITYGINIDSEYIITKPDSGDINDVTMWKYNIIDIYKIRLYIDNRIETIHRINELCTTFLIK